MESGTRFDTACGAGFEARYFENRQILLANQKPSSYNPYTDTSVWLLRRQWNVLQLAIGGSNAT